MSSQRTNGNGWGADRSDRGESVANPPDPLTQDMSDMAIDEPWKVITKKNRNRSAAPPVPKWGANASGSGSGSGRGGRNGSAMVNLNHKSNVNLATNASSSPWPVTPDPRKPVSRVNPPTRMPSLPPQPQPQPQQQPAPPGVQAPLVGGWNWAARARMAAPQPPPDEDASDEDDDASDDDDDDDDDDDLADDSDDDLADDYDSDASQKSHGTRKQNKWLKAFFDELDRLKVDEINEQTRQWHCPACANGPGAIEWYRGLQPLMTHAKTKGATRVKLHRQLATLLEEELRRRGTCVIPVGEQYGKWQGLKQTTADHEIVWPPMVIITNTFLDTDENDKHIGMGNLELLDYFSSYAAKKARHSYGPRGHRGISLLIFESNAMGYMEAERLHRHFEQQGTDRHAWDSKTKSRFLPGGQRQLFGYLAGKDDLEDFNRHCKGKMRLKYEMRSYQEMVVGPMRQMNEDNQQLHWLQRKVVKQEQRSKLIEQSFDVVSKRLRDSVKSVDLVRQRTRKHHQERKEEMDYLEQSVNEKIELVHRAIEEKEKNFQNEQQEQRSKATQSADIHFGSNEDRAIRKKEIELFIDNLEKGVEEFEAEKERLMQDHEVKKVQLKKEYLAKVIELEQHLDASLTQLMDKYKPSKFHASSATTTSIV